MNLPENRERGRSRVAHLRKVVARDVTEPGSTPPEVELRALLMHMDRTYPGWEEPAKAEPFPETLKGCKRLQESLRVKSTDPAKSKRTRQAFRERLDALTAHMESTFPS